MISKTHIYDMDGTIVCSLHRYRTVQREGREFIDLEHWLENEHLAHKDSLLPLADQYKRDLACPKTFVIIATARVLYTVDMQFIKDKLGLPDAIVSRQGRNDTRGGAALKITGLQSIFDTANLWNTKKVFFEDNFSYLQKVCNALNIKGRFIPSQQGH